MNFVIAAFFVLMGGVIEVLRAMGTHHSLVSESGFNLVFFLSQIAIQFFLGGFFFSLRERAIGGLSVLIFLAIFSSLFLPVVISLAIENKISVIFQADYEFALYTVLLFMVSSIGISLMTAFYRKSSALADWASANLPDDEDNAKLLISASKCMSILCVAVFFIRF